MEKGNKLWRRRRRRTRRREIKLVEEEEEGNKIFIHSLSLCAQFMNQ